MLDFLSDMSLCSKIFLNFVLLMTNEKLWDMKIVEAAPENFHSLIEHQVTPEEAKQVIKDIEPHSMISVGCQECSRAEMKYCQNDAVYDHCCCDSKYHEKFPYMEHTCYYEKTTCQPIARDCGEYSRIVDCCCHKYLANEWKLNYSKSQSTVTQSSFIIYLLCIYVNLLSLCKFNLKISKLQ